MQAAMVFRRIYTSKTVKGLKIHLFTFGQQPKHII